MSEIMIYGIPVTFPFEPYEVQKSYMEKVIESLQNNTNAVLESPTGTGKTLSLLCSSLAWLLVKKAQLQMNAQLGNFSEHSGYSNALRDNLKSNAGKSKDNTSWGMPKIIYSSRTHSQLTQAMQELKRSSYRHVKAAVLGSRDQMCIHPEVSKETNNMNKVHMCQLKVKSRTCHFYNNVESKKDDRSVKGDDILDIEDLVSVGKKLKCCPYYLSKELKQDADIIFMPYNYLLDPKSRRANGVELMNNIIILDEAHNVEKMCEESASLQIRTTDVALCIDEITYIMKSFADGEDLDVTLDPNQPKDFTCDDLCTLKEMMLAFEKAVDEIQVGSEGSTFPGGYIFELLSKAEITDRNQMSVIGLIENLIQYLSTASSSPFTRKGVGLQKIVDLLNVVFSGTTVAYKERVKLCYKVHVQVEDKKNNKKTDSWGALKASNTKSAERVLSYWCFSPGFGMKQLLEQNVRSIILTSGTLAPLKPLISELGIPIGVQLENPHIVKSNQIHVKIIGQGPDSETLNSNYQNRNNPKYISSLGRTILSFSRVIPDGLLVFFPSYPIMTKCQEMWQAEGIWSSINSIKPIFVEPQRKDTFNSIINDYYSKIRDPNSRGACFMAVCRGKVSEGLDFADMNGRAVIITGLPFPPLKDPRIILKKKYLEELRVNQKEYLSGDEWYSLEASRAVNQAIGRVIRHQNDYGAILLCDTRFNNPKLKNQLSAWLRDHIVVSNKFGLTVSEICRFFKNAEASLPTPKLKPLLPHESNTNFKESGAPSLTGVSFPVTNSRTVNKAKTINTVSQYPNSNEVYADFSIDFYKNAQASTYVNEFKPKATKDLFSALDGSSSTRGTSESLVTINKRPSQDIPILAASKKKKLKIKSFGFEENLHNGGTSELPKERMAPTSLIDFVKEIKTLLEPDEYKKFQLSISTYKKEGDYDVFLKMLSELLENSRLFYLFKGMKRFLKDDHKQAFDEYCDNVKFPS
ncbi:regulator of telomere elongation helicase 1 protein [Danaus plexippus plexippus]|uniref:Regulator of telomere elongation helicase 1 homolog n=1 Tax=Danaus plexippus plexippus TaxID=278856 RepID=A0A212FNT3_DANPL|nr:regulator of telomere elongation helicase 1 protein [Danaus plexippus plexippus]